MKVILAVPHGDYSAGMPVDLPDAEARQLVFDGHARKAPADAPAPVKRAPAKKPTAKTTNHVPTDPSGSEPAAPHVPARPHRRRAVKEKH